MSAEARLGQLDQAEAHLHEAAALLLANPPPASAALVLTGLAWVELGHGRGQRATVLLGVAAATRQAIGLTPVGAERIENELALDAARAQLGAGAVATTLANRRTLTTKQALRMTLGLATST